LEGVHEKVVEKNHPGRPVVIYIPNGQAQNRKEKAKETLHFDNIYLAAREWDIGISFG
jgi:hypothetical protein